MAQKNLPGYSFNDRSGSWFCDADGSGPYGVNASGVPYLMGVAGTGGGGGSGTADSTAANQSTQIAAAGTTNTEVGPVTETAPATDTASSGLNGRLQRIAQRLTSLMALLPGLGTKVMTGAQAVTLATDDTQIGAKTTASVLSAGGSGIMGWLSDMTTSLKALVSSTPANGAAVSGASRPVVLATDDVQVGAPATGYVFTTGGLGIKGLLSDIAIACRAFTGGSGVTPTDVSGTIATGGTSQALAGASATRKGYMVQNLSTADLWINELGVAAVLSQPSIRIPPGALYECQSSGPPVTAIAIIGATSGQAFTARTW